MQDSFLADLTFLKQYIDPVLLQNNSGKAIIVAPQYQARVMTSTWSVQNGSSPGWINYNWFTNQANQAHINPIGGEERLWLGPEGGQYSWFFQQGQPFDYEHWQTPPVLDTLPFEIEVSEPTLIKASTSISLTNASNTKFPQFWIDDVER